MTKTFLLVTFALSLIGSAAVRADPPVPCCPNDNTWPMCLHSDVCSNGFRLQMSLDHRTR